MNQEILAINLNQTAEFYLSQGKLEIAYEICQSILADSPNFSPTYNTQGKVLQAMGKIESAITSYRQGIQLNPQQIETYKILGDILVKQEKLSEAIACYETAIKYHPKVSIFHHKLGLVFIELKNWDEAVNAFCRAIQFNPNFPWSYHSLGEALTQQKKWHQAVIAYQSAIEIKPDLYWSYQHLGNALIKQGKRDEAIVYYQDILQRQPHLDIIHKLLGDALVEKDEIDAAIPNYLRAIQLNPDSSWYYNNLGEVFLNLKRWNSAIFTFLTALDIEPDMPWIYQKLGEALGQISQGNLEDKINYYSQAIQNDRREIINSKLVLSLPRNSDLYLYLGNALTKEEQYKVAVIIYNMALQLKVNDQEITNQLQKTLEKQAELEQEVERCHKAIEQNPKSSEFYYDLGIALTRQEEWEKASMAFLTAIKLKPEKNWCYGNLWDYLKKSDKVQEVVNFYRRIIPKMPDSFVAHLNLGKALTEQEKIDEAIIYYRTACYQQSLKSHPNFVNKYWHQKQVANPNFIIIGTGKSGTTSLYNYLTQHPQVLPAIKKEIYFWSRYFDKGIDWYLSHFPPIPQETKLLTGEATPTYINSWHTPERLFSIFPKIKLIVILRNPVDRAVSHYYHEVRLKMENKSLSAVIYEQLERLKKIPTSALEEAYWNHISYYVSYGVYVEFLKKWMTIFPREQFLILSSEDFYQEPQITMENVFKFLDLPKHQLQDYQKLNSGSYPNIPPSIYSTLSDYFQPYNQKLEEYLGMKFNWE